MDPKALIDDLLTAGRTTLTESESKLLLGHYNIPVVEEMLVATADEAATAAANIGFPVVLKGHGETLLHKSESGLVHLQLADERAVRRAAEQIHAAAPAAGLLVQPQVQGRREFVIGLFRDAQFGPVILFGLGGVLTEALDDVVLRLAPLTGDEAAQMVASIRAQALLGPFRGEDAVDARTLEDILLAVSTLAMEQPQIAEIDINPLVADAVGQLTAVDALVTLAPDSDGRKESIPVASPAIRALFYPRSIAFVGASSTMGKWGHMLICNTISGGYAGEVYAVNPKGGTISGKSAYGSVDEIPGSVDLAVVTVPANAVLDLVPQLEAKGVQSMVLITSGFGETGEEGRQLEAKLVAAASKAGILILGPNTMGICNPHIDFFCTGAAVAPLAGSTAVVAQSGNMGTQLLAFAEAQGIGIRAFCGSGNESMISIEDYMEGFEVDDLTRTVMLYVEGIRDGRRFFESARRLSRTKPIVLLKGGRTAAGTKAAASHTGAMASDSRIFDAACRQAGIVRVDQPMELLDLSAAFSSLPLPQGNRVAIMTLGGGWGVVTADLCNRFGLEVPQLSAELISAIDKILPPYWSRANPIDLVGENDTSIPLTVMETLLAWEGCDAVINLGILGRRIFSQRLADSIQKADPAYSPEFLADVVDGFKQYEQYYVAQIVRLMETYNKPVFGVSLLRDANEATVYRVDDQKLKAVFYETPEQAVKAAARMVEYQRYHARQE